MIVLIVHTYNRQKNLDVLEQTFRDVSDPQSAKWGQFLTKEQVDNIVRPDEGK